MNDAGKSRIIALLGAGMILFVLGLVLGQQLMKGGGAPAVSGAAEEGPGLYTCGMHPNVIQEGPGICPICNMDLTPLKKSTSGSGTKEKKIKYWVAPMDPSFISDKPGKSPMGMDLVPVYEEGAESDRAVVIDPAVVQNIGVRTGEVTRGSLAKTIRATGEIVEDETRVGIVNLKIAGWIENVFVDETGQAVRKGDPLLEIYSPQLVTTQEEYLIALENLRRVEDAPGEVVAAARRTLESTRRRLLYWDVTEGQIADLERAGEVRKTLAIRSPFTGVVTMKSALPGQKVAPGTDLYHVADLSGIWVKASVFDSDLPYVRLHQEAAMTLSFLPGKTFTGTVTFISPVLNPKTRDLSIRLEFPNDGGLLKPGMYADVAIRSVLDESAVLIPEEAVIRSGKRNVVFIARGEGRFVPTEVKLGPRGEENTIQVIAGVLPGERVVTSAQFLLDSESSFQEALRKMMGEQRSDKAPVETTNEAMTAGTEGRGKHAPPPREDYAPHLNALFEGEPVANAVAVDEKGAVTIVCPIMKGEKVVEAGDPYTMHDGMRVYYCCPGCQSTFEEDPEGHLSELAAFIREKYAGAPGFVPHVKASFEGAPVANALSIEPDGGVTILCPVMKGPRTIEPGDVYTVYRGMRVYYCCPACQETFESDPERYLAELGEALKSRS
ncbi:MAG: efflux RND transporter periplasmic adaptor subunit [Candidatus Eisenbacteria bacterium]